MLKHSEGLKGSVLALALMASFAAVQAQAEVSSDVGGVPHFLWNGPYVSFGLGFGKNRSAGSGKVSVSQKNVPGTTDRTFKNKKRSFPEFNVDLGYRWNIDEQDAFGLAARLGAVRPKTLKGESYYTKTPEDKNSYSYKLKTLDLALVGQYIYAVNDQLEAYAELAAGRASLKSYGYVNKIYDDQFNSRKVSKLSVGAALGLRWFVMPEASLGVNVGYQSLGKAELGSYVLPKGKSGKSVSTLRSSSLNQPVKLIKATLTASYWF